MNKWLRRFSLLAVTAVMLGQALGQNLSTDQLRELANQAKSSGDLQSEAGYLCQAASIDQNKYGKKCDHAHKDVSQALAQFQADMGMARKEINKKDYLGALRDLEKITFGPDRLEAQVLMQQIRAGGPLDSQVEESLHAFLSARSAYKRGDFDTAEGLLKTVQSPVVKPAADQLLLNINVYRRTLKEAQALEQSKNYQEAEQKYQFILTIAVNGPGQPQERLRAVRAEEAMMAKEQPTPQPSIANLTAKAAPPSKPNDKPPVNDAGKLEGMMNAARRAEKRGDLKLALRGYSEVLQMDSRQADAAAGKARITAAMQSDLQHLQSKLEAGVAAFYASHFDEANDAIHAYLQVGSKQYAGAAHFYLGASLLSQAIFKSPTDHAAGNALREEATKEFSQAQQLNFHPVESSVSPKILAQWSQAGSQR